MARRAVGRPWTAREDQLLADAVAVHGQVDSWKAVALAVPDRTNKACRKRWLHSLSPTVKKTAWSKDEDDLLRELYSIHSAKWAVIARNIPGRTDDACSKRYREALDPALKKDEWTPDEDDRLLAAYNRLGGKWGRVGQELQRSGLGCRNRWRLLQRKRLSSSPPDSSKTPSTHVSAWPAESLPMAGYWDDPSPQPGSSSSHHVDIFPRDPPPQLTLSHPVDYTPFDYFTSSLTSALAALPPPHPLRYAKDADATVSSARQSLVLPTASVSDPISTRAFPPFDYESSSSACALSVGSTSPAPQASYTENTRDTDVYSDRPHEFHQLHRSLPPTAVPVHTPSVHPMQVDHYTASVPHEECTLPHAALSTRHQPTLQPSPLPAQTPASSYFTTSQLPDQQASYIPSPMTSVSLLDSPDSYYHPPPDSGLDVNAQHTLLHTPDPLSLSESRPGYHYAHPCLSSRARVMETMHGQEQRAEYHHNHVQPDRSLHAPSNPPASSPLEKQYALQRSDSRNLDSQSEAGPLRPTPDQYRASNPLLSSQLVQRSIVPSRPTPMPYSKSHPLDGSSHSKDGHPPPAPRQKIGLAAPRKRSDAQSSLRLSSELQATDDPSIKPYACGHESCWPSDAASSRACYCTSRGLSDHNKSVHPEDGGGDRPYRCGLEGCGKSWKSINGLQYHLQISKAHFQHAISSSFVSSYISDLAVPASVEASTSGDGGEKTKKHYTCPHENCPNRYKQLSGLRYHLAHGHPVDLPKQLDLVPPALSRKLAEKMRFQGPVLSSHEPRRCSNGAEPSTQFSLGSSNA